MARRRSSHSRPYQRTARVNELLREIVAEELHVIGDDRLELIAVTGVRVDPELRRGLVLFDTPAGDGSEDAGVLEALGEYRVRLQRAIADQARLRRTPELRFAPDEGARTGLRVEGILRDLDGEPGGTNGASEA